MIDRFTCMLRGHLPNRRKVKLVDGTYYGTCNRCGARVRRVKRDHWVALWPWQKY